MLRIRHPLIRASGLFLFLMAMVATGHAQSEKSHPEEKVKIPPKVLAAYKKGGALFKAGKLNEAAAQYSRAVAYVRQHLGADHLQACYLYDDVGLLLATLGRNKEAEKLYRRSVRIREKKLGKNHSLVSNSLNNLGELYRTTGRYAEAESILRRSLRIREKVRGKNHPDVGQSLNNLGGLYRGMGQFAKAADYFQRCLKIVESKLEPTHPFIATCLNNVAVAYLNLGEYAQAEAYFRKSLKVRLATVGEDHPEVALTLNNIAYLRQSRGEPAEAAPLFERGLAVLVAKFGNDHHTVVLARTNLADLYQVLGRYDDSAKHLREALAVVERRSDLPAQLISGALYSAACLQVRTGKAEDAARQFERALRVMRQYTTTVLPMLSEVEQTQFLVTQFMPGLHAALTLALSHSDDPLAVERSAGWILNAKGVVQEVLGAAALRQRDADDSRVGEKAEALAQLRQQLARLSLTSPAEGREESHRQQLAELNAREQELAREVRQAGGAVAPPALWIEPKKLQECLPDDSAFVDFVRVRRFDFAARGAKQLWGPDQYAAWIHRPGKAARIVHLGPADDIDRAIAAAQRALESAGDTIQTRGELEAEEQVRAALVETARRVLHPLLPHVAAARRLILSPDANLWLVPWAALPMPEGAYAIEGHTFGLVVSGRDLLSRGREATVTARRPLVVADPDFDLDRKEATATAATLGKELARSTSATRSPRRLGLGQVRRLPGTAAEAAAIAPKLEQWTGSRPHVYTGRRALEAVIKNAHGPRVLVASTHGFFLSGADKNAASGFGGLGDNPLLRCGLLLAGCNNPPKEREPGDDGVLTGMEIVGTDLRGTELVVLSACETGLGEVRFGEGVAGLRQAFQLAGAEAVVATLWQIPDRQSAQLMIRFFDGLAAKKDKATALAEAQREMIKQRREKTGAAHPFFWAAYTLTGR